MTDALVIGALRKLGNVPFRVEWFGDVTYAGRVGGRSPLINVVLARGHNGDWVRGVEDNGQAIIATVPMGYLRLLRMGDIWVLGQRVGACPKSIRLTFPDLFIDDTTTDVRPAGLPISETDSDPRYLLPFSEFDAHRSHTGAFCACVSMPEGVTLVVPCMELVRFYFGASGALLKRLFSGAFALDNLYTSARCSISTGIGNITLADGLPFGAGATAARIAFDRWAQQAAAWISKSGVAATANGERYYPKTTFPFKGRTDLTVEGRWLDAEPNRVFLVERILQCTHPFPFRRLYVRSATEVAGDRRPDGKGSPKKAKSRNTADESNARERTLLEGYVTRARMPVAIEAEDEPALPFPDLVGKPVHRMASEAGGGQSGPATDVGACDLAAGAELSDEGKRDAEVMAASVPDLVWEMEPKEVMRFRMALDDLVKRGETTAALLPPVPGKRNWNPGGPFQRGDWLVPEPDGKSRAVWCARLWDRAEPTRAGSLVVVRPPVDLVGWYKVAVVRLAVTERLDQEDIHRRWATLADLGWIPEPSETVSVFRDGRLRRPEALREFIREVVCPRVGN